jgi:hypothetical protein
MKEELIADYADYLPDIARDAMRRIRGEQELVVEFARDEAIETLPVLVSDPADRERLTEFFERVFADRRMQSFAPTPEQRATSARIKAAFEKVPGRPRLAAVPK